MGDKESGTVRIESNLRECGSEGNRYTRVEAFKAASKARQEIRAQSASASLSPTSRPPLASPPNTPQNQQPEAMRLTLKSDENRMREVWRMTNQRTWDRIRGVFKVEEEKLGQKMEEARRAEEEKRGVEITGFESARDDWVSARTTLKQPKEGPLKMMKSNPEMKKIRSKYRRMITPKIGQITNDLPTIRRITEELTSIVLSNPPHPPTLYIALLSSLSKAILFQSEIEVSAFPPSALALARVTAHLLRTLPYFPQVFYARILHRSGGWFIPYPIPPTDVDGQPWGDDVAKRKALGLRNGGEEMMGEMMGRVVGIMRVYWEVVKCGLQDGQPGSEGGSVDGRYEVGRLWVWFARMTQEVGMLRQPIAAELISVALSVLGTQGLSIYGRQWIKMLELLYGGVTQGISPASAQPSTIGGDTAEGKAAKVRVQLEIERIMNV